MRTIKFRAWDKADGQMYYAIEDGIEFDDGSVYEFRNFLTPRKDDYHKWEIMQFTGMKDKNGKEIYEGDILRHKATSNFEDFDELMEITIPDIYRMILIFKADEFEVIGNIYENKSLIN